MTFDLERAVIKATKAALTEIPYIPAGLREYAQIVAVAAPVIIRAVTDEIRALHEPVIQQGYAVEPWTECAACRLSHHCPTVRLCDEIDTSAGVQR